MAPSERGRAVAAVLAAPAALLSFVGYLAWALHDPFAWSRAQTAWGRAFSLSGFWHSLAQVPTAHHPYGEARDVVCCIVYFCLLWVARQRGVPWAWILAGTAAVALPLASGTFASEARFGLLAFSMYWGIASVVAGRRTERVIAVASIVLLAVFTVTIPLAFP